MNGKKKIIIFLSIILIISSLLAFYLSMKYKKDPSEDPSGSTTVNPGGNGNNSNNEKLESVEKEIGRLNTDVIFDIQKMINDFLEVTITSNNERIISYLDQDYVKLKNINTVNLEAFVNKSYSNPSYIVNKVLCNNSNKIVYYFVTGYILDNDFETTKLQDNISYLLIVKNGYYVLIPLEREVDIDTYSRNYNIINKDIPTTNSYKRSNISEKNKMVMYIANYMNLLIANTRKAYSMLGEEALKKYDSFDDFNNRVTETYKSISATVFAYNISTKDNKTIYKIKDNKQRTIEIIEDYPMDYKINY